MGFLSVLGMAHKLVAERLSPGDTAIDGTCGNGNDTLFLAERTGRRGCVYAFDIQEQALKRTRQRLASVPHERLPELHLIHGSHAGMAAYIGQAHRNRLAAVMFNLGYLPGPGADASIITETSSTLAALEASLDLLRTGGILTVVLYPGHPGGDSEAAAVEEWAAELPSVEGQAVLYRMPQKPAAPFLLAVEKKTSRT
ncbi:class I SAM-dependent methyltransferase [Paenibacillus nasutitermitis]|uniref:SAM-dependent methyltransferase n=1 Tax=Paenibacillus nasutitermitis TaxID=1652958 RepID=A0A916YK57_9BACL|nr:class I SAM-dependent methyltransferase [Paenibacillus nasutitermitis]GGD48101.1 SAM-dependent methyltransferase [Paenibacillus nasutitermitis]